MNTDEEDWEEFKQLVGITVSWLPYSEEAKHAKSGFQAYAFTGLLLLKYVKIELDFAKAKTDYQTKLEFLKKVLEL